jgi:tryptophan 2,3-dioxygenase
MHEMLSTTAAESTGDIAEKDIDDPRRFTFFHTFVNTNYETIWLSILRHVRVPGVYRTSDESPEDFYQRIVQNDEVREAVACVDLKDVTYLMQFRAYHQISEILVGLVNDLIAETILALTNETQSSFEHEAGSLALCNKLLQIVTDNIKPIVRTLSPKAYFAIRSALGITSGSHSHNLRKGLFLTIYPLLVRSLRLRIVNFDEIAARDDGSVLDQSLQVLRSNVNPKLATLIRQAVYVYQYVRTWRDEHIQFVKTQIGLSPEDNTPTASISGAENAAQTAHNFRSAYKTDPIGPLYEAVLGKRPPTPIAIVHSGRFDEYMASFTADAVQEMYVDVQQRAQRKRNTRAGAPS